MDEMRDLQMVEAVEAEVHECHVTHADVFPVLRFLSHPSMRL